jgi:4-amino-4-deoxy-L-arabinose transferase-like glycosyltransferase
MSGPPETYTPGKKDHERNTASRINAEKRALALLVILAVIIRVVWWISSIRSIENEGAEYLRLAESLFSGKGFIGIFGGPQLIQHPLYPILIGSVDLVAGDLELSGRIISLICGIALLIGIVFVTRQLFGARAALLAALLAAVHPVLVGLSVAVLSECLAMFLTIWGVYFAIQGMNKRTRFHGALCGTCLGLGYLARPEVLFFSPIIAAILCVWGGLYNGRMIAAIHNGVAPLCVALAVSAPWMIYLSAQVGRFQWEGKSVLVHSLNMRMRVGNMTVAEAHVGVRPSNRLPVLFDKGMMLDADDQAALIREHYVPFTKRIREVLDAVSFRARAVKWKLESASFLGSPWLPLIGLVGLTFSGWWRRHWGGGVLLAGVGAFQLSTLLLVEFHFDRYFFPLVPMMIPWTAAGLDVLIGLGSRMLSAIGSTETRARTAMAAAALAAIVICAKAYPPARQVYDLHASQDEAVKLLGQWIRQEAIKIDSSRERPIVMASSSLVPFYSGGVLALLPYGDLKDVLEYIHRKAPDFIVLEASQRNWMPYTLDWIEKGIPDPCAVLLKQVESPMSGVKQVWRWTCRAKEFEQNLHIVGASKKHFNEVQ